MTVEVDGTKIWRNEEGQLYRDDGSAVIRSSGTKLWHNEDGQMHREDGPAVIWADGKKEWWIEGKRYSFQEWADELNLDQKTRLEMVLKWNPE